MSQVGPKWDTLTKTTDASGLSPFAAFDLRLPFTCGATTPNAVDCLFAPLNQAYGLVVFLDIEAQPGSLVSDVATCR